MRLRLLPKSTVRRLSFLLAATVAIAGLSACGSGGSSGSAGNRDIRNNQLVGLDADRHGDRRRLHRCVQQAVSRTSRSTTSWSTSRTGWPRCARALASGQGPDVFDMQPGAYVTQFESFAEDLTPMAEQALGSDWKYEGRARSASAASPPTGKLVAMSVGAVYAGMLWINADIVPEVQPDAADDAQRVGARVSGAQAEQRRLLRAGRGAGGLRPGHAAVDRQLGAARAVDEGLDGRRQMERPGHRPDAGNLEADVRRRHHADRVRSATSSTRTPTTTS